MKFSKKHKLAILLLFIIITTIISLIIFWLLSNDRYTDLKLLKDPKHCLVDLDCIVFGTTGECDAGCYNRTFERQKPQVDKNASIIEQFNANRCYNLAPTSCVCENNECKGSYNSK